MAFKMRATPYPLKSALKHTRAQGHSMTKDVPHTHTQNRYSNIEGYEYGDVIPDEVMVELYKDPNFDDLTTPSFIEKKKKKKKKKYQSNKDFCKENPDSSLCKEKDTWFRDVDNDGNVISRGLRNIGDWFSKKRVRTPRNKRTRNLVTGGWNVTSGRTGRTRHRR